MNILLVLATSAEAEIIRMIPGISQEREGLFIKGKHNISVLITGVGGISTAWSMKQWLSINIRPDLAINAGIAGSFREKFAMGEVVIPISDCFADLGIEIDSKYQTLAEAGLVDLNETPFENGFLVMRNDFYQNISSIIPSVNAVTVNTSSGSPASIERLIKKFNPDIETMEGATFFYICIREKIPFLALRAISNYVEPGRRSAWEIPLALKNLAGRLDEVLNIL